MLIASPEPERILSALSEAGIAACVIGKFTSAEDGFKRVDKVTGSIAELTPPEADELYGM
jgi:hydrogenase expression/formation protein HypE